MIIFPAIDLIEGKAVRLLKGDYNQMTIYSNAPKYVAEDFKASGATHVHVVDLEGAKDGTTPNLETVKEIKSVGLFTEVGGGVRNIETVEKYLGVGVDRVILGTAAVNDQALLKESLRLFGDKIAVGVDIKDGKVAIKGWLEKSEYDAKDFCKHMQDMGVKTIICTDISKDGAMMGTNQELYRELQEELKINITASGGISSIADVEELREKNLYGAIIGKAYYLGAIDLADAIEVAR